MMEAIKGASFFSKSSNNNNSNNNNNNNATNNDRGGGGGGSENSNRGNNTNRKNINNNTNTSSSSTATRTTSVSSNNQSSIRSSRRLGGDNTRSKRSNVTKSNHAMSPTTRAKQLTQLDTLATRTTSGLNNNNRNNYKSNNISMSAAADAQFNVDFSNNTDEALIIQAVSSKLSINDKKNSNNSSNNTSSSNNNNNNFIPPPPPPPPPNTGVLVAAANVPMWESVPIGNNKSKTSSSSTNVPPGLSLDAPTYSRFGGYSNTNKALTTTTTPSKKNIKNNIKTFDSPFSTDSPYSSQLSYESQEVIDDDDDDDSASSSTSTSYDDVETGDDSASNSSSTVSPTSSQNSLLKPNPSTLSNFSVASNNTQNNRSSLSNNTNIITSNNIINTNNSNTRLTNASNRSTGTNSISQRGAQQPNLKEIKNNSDSGEDYSDDEDEGEDGYKAGGYHPVKIAEVYHQRYVIIKKLGWGHFSTVWMVKDRKVPDTFLALKVQKSAEHYTEAAMDEIELLDCIAQERNRVAQPKLVGTDQDGHTWVKNVEHSNHVATLLDSFFHTGPNGRHMCMVFQMLGCNLLSVIKAWEYRGIPIPAVKNMIRGMLKGLDFLHRKCHIIHTDLKPENVLLEFLPCFNNSQDGSYLDDYMLSEDQQQQQQQQQRYKNSNNSNSQPNRKFHAPSNKGHHHHNHKDGLLDAALSDVELERILEQQSLDCVTGSSSKDETVASSLSASGVVRSTSSFSSPDKVLRRLQHSTFVSQNYSNQLHIGTTPLDAAFDDLASVRCPTPAEMSYYLNHEVGLAEVTFLIRAYVPESEIADSISAALGIPWEVMEENGSSVRHWRCELSLRRPNDTTGTNATSRHHHPSSRNMKNNSTMAAATMFQLSQKNRKQASAIEKKAMTELVRVVSLNLCGDTTNVYNSSPNKNNSSQYRCLPFSQFSVKFSVLSTVVVLAFLESRLPGVMFFTYKREEGLPALDPIVFGPCRGKICRHPMSMKVRDTQQQQNQQRNKKSSSASSSDNTNTITNTTASCLFGFDLRLVKEFNSRPIVGEDGSTSFRLSGMSIDCVSNWWHARNSIYSRVKSFMGIDPAADGIDMSMLLTPRTLPKNNAPQKDQYNKNNDNYDHYKEESKKLTPLSHHSSLVTSSNPGGINATKKNSATVSKSTHISTAISRASATPNLKKEETLSKARAVVVDLGNACWTHRHFSEDIQTRQYRSPEVVIGGSYDTSADIWSLGCICFELLTGDLLFDPRAGEDYDRDEDHLAMFQELLGKIPKKTALSGKYSKHFFTRKGDLKHIQQLKYWPIQEVLVEKYHFTSKDANAVAKFLLPLLEFDPKKRQKAWECLKSDWLREDSDSNNSNVNSTNTPTVAVLKSRRRK